MPKASKMPSIPNPNFQLHVGWRTIKTAVTAMLVAVIYCLVGRNPAFACIGVIFGLGYDMQDSLKLNPGIYLQEMNCFPGLYDFIWYAGLWGKTTCRIPQTVTYEKVGDGENRSETQSITFILRPEKNAAILSYGGVPRFSFDYFPVSCP